MVFDLLKLEQYLKSYELFQFKSFSVFTVRAGPQVGPGRFQAGMEAEEAGLRAGPDRGAGRASRRRHTRFSGVTGVQTCALPI